MRPTYTEIYVCNKNTNKNTDTSIDDVNLNVFDISVTKERFMQLIENVARKPTSFKAFQKQFKTYNYQDLYMENKDDKDIEVYEKTMLMYAYDEEKDLLHVSFHKKKESFNVFPSTTNLNTIMFTDRLSFLVNSHIYLNFDVCHYMDKNDEGSDPKLKESDRIYKVFVNLNTEKNIDIENSRILIENAIDFVLK